MLSFLLKKLKNSIFTRDAWVSNRNTSYLILKNFRLYQQKVIISTNQRRYWLTRKPAAYVRHVYYSQVWKDNDLLGIFFLYFQLCIVVRRDWGINEYLTQTEKSLTCKHYIWFYDFLDENYNCHPAKMENMYLLLQSFTNTSSSSIQAMGWRDSRNQVTYRSRLLSGNPTLQRGDRWKKVSSRSLPEKSSIKVLGRIKKQIERVTAQRVGKVKKWIRKKWLVRLRRRNWKFRKRDAKPYVLYRPRKSWTDFPLKFFLQAKRKWLRDGSVSVRSMRWVKRKLRYLNKSRWFIKFSALKRIKNLYKLAKFSRQLAGDNWKKFPYKIDRRKLDRSLALKITWLFKSNQHLQTPSSIYFFFWLYLNNLHIALIGDPENQKHLVENIYLNYLKTIENYWGKILKKQIILRGVNLSNYTPQEFLLAAVQKRRHKLPRVLNILYPYNVYELFYLSLLTKDLTPIKKWVLGQFRTQPFKVHRVIRRFLFNILLNYFWHYRTILNLQGMFLEFKGKLQKRGARKQVKRKFKGLKSFSTKTLKMTTLQFPLWTISGSVHFKLSIFF